MTQGVLCGGKPLTRLYTCVSQKASGRKYLGLRRCKAKYHPCTGVRWKDSSSTAG